VGGSERRVFRSTGRDVRDGLLGLLPLTLVVLITAEGRRGLSVDGVGPAVLVAVVVAAADALVRPALRVLAGRAGAITALLLGVASQVLLVWVALTVAPGVHASGVPAVLGTLVTVALLSAVTRWIIGVSDSSYLVGDLLRRARGRRRRAGRGPLHDEGAPGLVIVQIDGLSSPLLDHALLAGRLPTLGRWLRTGQYAAATWWARMPSTTPSSQAGLLHGSDEEVPAFRWYEKDTGRLVVANRPADAALIESRLSDGTGLLSGGGVSISTLFSGDATICQLVVSRVGAGDALGPGTEYLRFFASPFVFVRALLRTAGEMVKELWQARQQRIRGVEPRVARPGSYVLLRGVSNALLRDLNVTLVAEHMMRGAPVIFVDFVDYDEIAHHAGLARPEAMDALTGLDRTLAVLEQIADAADREYRFVVLSDHGQSQGAPFRQLAGASLEEAVRTLVGVAADTTVVSTADAEMWGPVNALLSEVLGNGRTRIRWARRRGGADTTGVLVGPQPLTVTEPAADDGTPPELVVAGSGNLGLVWLPRLAGRVVVEVLRDHYPRLLPGVLRLPGIGFVVVASGRGPLAIGPQGAHVLAEHVIEGKDPLAGLGPRAAADLLRVARMTHAADVLVHSTVDSRTGEVHAFEELVGSHGGLGGWQNLAVLVHPADWAVDVDLLDRSVPEEPMLIGAPAVHQQLVRWLERARIRPATTPECAAGRVPPEPDPAGAAKAAEDVA
jgi:hypothetical protein